MSSSTERWNVAKLYVNQMILWLVKEYGASPFE